MAAAAEAAAGWGVSRHRSQTPARYRVTEQVTGDTGEPGGGLGDPRLLGGGPPRWAITWSARPPQQPASSTISLC